MYLSIFVHNVVSSKYINIEYLFLARYYRLFTTTIFKTNQYNAHINVHNNFDWWDMNNYFKNERITYKQYPKKAIHEK